MRTVRNKNTGTCIHRVILCRPHQIRSICFHILKQQLLQTKIIMDTRKNIMDTRNYYGYQKKLSAGIQPFGIWKEFELKMNTAWNTHSFKRKSRTIVKLIFCHLILGVCRYRTENFLLMHSTANPETYAYIITVINNLEPISFAIGLHCPMPARYASTSFCCFLLPFNLISFILCSWHFSLLRDACSRSFAAMKRIVLLKYERTPNTTCGQKKTPQCSVSRVTQDICGGKSTLVLSTSEKTYHTVQH